MELPTPHGAVLVCPLGWGLGHASRVIPIIQRLLDDGLPVVVAADPPSNALIGQHFPGIPCVHFPSLPVRLPKHPCLGFALMGLGLRLLLWTRREHKMLQPLLTRYRVGLIISDNRYGLYSAHTPSVLITHQLRVRLPHPFRWAAPLARAYVRRYASRFTQCWVPDYPQGFSLAGQLSRGIKGLGNMRRIGLLSRFQGVTPSAALPAWELVVLISGPEPQRTLFEAKALALAQRLGLHTLIVRGMPLGGQAVTRHPPSATMVGHMDTQALANALAGCNFIICRAGYSTLMDLVTLGRSALLVPTPGQTEQEYLASHLGGLGLFASCRQEHLERITLDVLRRIPCARPLGHAT